MSSQREASLEEQIEAEMDRLYQGGVNATGDYYPKERLRFLISQQANQRAIEELKKLKERKTLYGNVASAPDDYAFVDFGAIDDRLAELEGEK